MVRLSSLLVTKRLVPATQLGVVCSISCATPRCSCAYVGESGRTLEERRKEHEKAVRNIDVARSEVAQHVHEADNRVGLGGMIVVDRESMWLQRCVEAIW